MSVLEGCAVDQQHLLRTLFLGHARNKEKKFKGTKHNTPHLKCTEYYMAMRATTLNSFLKPSNDKRDKLLYG